MKTFCKKSLLSLAISACIVGTQTHAGAATGGATEPTQIMNNIELLMSNAQLAVEVKTTIEQLQTMYTNLKKLKDFVNNGDAVISELTKLRPLQNRLLFLLHTAAVNLFAGKQENPHYGEKILMISLFFPQKWEILAILGKNRRKKPCLPSFFIKGDLVRCLQ